MEKVKIKKKHALRSVLKKLAWNKHCGKLGIVRYLDTLKVDRLLSLTHTLSLSLSLFLSLSLSLSLYLSLSLCLSVSLSLSLSLSDPFSKCYFYFTSHSLLLSKKLHHRLLSPKYTHFCIEHSLCGEL